MGKGKGKKAWSKIDVRDVEDAHIDAAAVAAAGGPVEERPDESLFFVDTVKDDGEASTFLWDLSCGSPQAGMRPLTVSARVDRCSEEAHAEGEGEGAAANSCGQHSPAQPASKVSGASPAQGSQGRRARAPCIVWSRLMLPRVRKV